MNLLLSNVFIRSSTLAIWLKGKRKEKKERKIDSGVDGNICQIISNSHAPELASDLLVDICQDVYTFKSEILNVINASFT